MTALRAKIDMRKAIPPVAAITGAAAMFAVPVGTDGEVGVRLLSSGRDFGLFGLALATAATDAWMVSSVDRVRSTTTGVLTGIVALLLGAIILLRLGDGFRFSATNPYTYFAIAVVAWISWRALTGMALGTAFAWRVLVPLIFGVLILYMWEVVVRGFGIPAIILPSPSAIAVTLFEHIFVLFDDFVQTVLRSAIPGFVIGSGAGIFVAVLIDRSPFLQRGLLPLGSAVSAMPIVGIAPIMVMWFGFGWESKAAVVVVMTFFPMLINTLAGLNSPEHQERDLMHSYSASYFEILVKLRLPRAMPFMFNAFKLNSTLAMIGAIVAEFFGTPLRGMGFRIVVEVGRLNMEIVWATVVMAAVSGMLFYGFIALAERVVTFWHPSVRLGALHSET